MPEASLVKDFAAKSYNDQWKEAMDWWRRDEEFRCLIRNTANEALSQDLEGTGQGIGSSDTNHQVFSMYREWLYYSSIDGNNDLLNFLMEYANGTV
jgi:hypothetical protein